MLCLRCADAGTNRCANAFAIVRSDTDPDFSAIPRTDINAVGSADSRAERDAIRCPDTESCVVRGYGRRRSVQRLERQLYMR